MKPQIRVNLIPLYRCNQNCGFCLYSHEKQNQNTMSLSWLDESLSNISRKYDIAQIKVSGGEIALLSDLYFEMLYNILKIHCKKIIIETNFINFKKGIINNCDIINVKYNFNDYSPFKQQVFSNIKAAVDTGKIINVKSLDISCKTDQSAIIEQLNILKIKSWEIIPFHQTINTRYKFKGYDEYEEVVRTFLRLSHKMKFAFQNKLQLEGILNIDNYNIKTLYMTPNDKFAVQAFENNNFYLREMDNLDEINNYFIEMEKKRDKICRNCTSKLKCMANYFLNLDYNGPSCSGYKDLLTQYK